ncbi:hypothetical protein B0H13DRAFT_1855070 [Mycena leptocephala]|nr:hypothetical protein B0H13DRAFT_1855070 [Mycena leptocephala]
MADSVGSFLYVEHRGQDLPAPNTKQIPGPHRQNPGFTHTPDLPNSHRHTDREFAHEPYEPFDGFFAVRTIWLMAHMDLNLSSEFESELMVIVGKKGDFVILDEGFGNGLTFTPSNISASIGDTVTLHSEFHPKNHTVTHSSFLQRRKAFDETSTTGQVGFNSGLSVPPDSVSINNNLTLTRLPGRWTSSH